MSDANQLLRQWQLLRMLSARRAGLTLREMAADTGRSQKTIRRDLLVLQQVGFPLSERVSDHGRKHWRLAGLRGDAGQNGNGQSGGDRLKPVATNGWPSLSFNLDEAIALYLGRQLIEPLAGTCFWEGAQTAFRKIQAGLGEKTLAYLEQQLPMLEFARADQWGRSPFDDRKSANHQALFPTQAVLQWGRSLMERKVGSRRTPVVMCSLRFKSRSLGRKCG